MITLRRCVSAICVLLSLPFSLFSPSSCSPPNANPMADFAEKKSFKNAMEPKRSMKNKIFHGIAFVHDCMIGLWKSFQYFFM